jgi:hypothetical protein
MVLNYKKIYENSLIASCGVLGFYILYLIFKYSNYGFDFTDEGFYLNWISNPYIYKSSVSSFGFFYNPIYSLLNNNVTYLRIANLIFSLFLSYMIFFFLIKQIAGANLLKKHYFSSQILLIGLSTTILLSVNIFSPSYNTLTIQGLIITSLGLLFLENNNKKISTLFIISFGGWLVFMGKPSSAFILSLIIFIYFLIKKVQIYRIVLCIFFSLILLLITSLAIDNSPLIFLKRILTGIKDYHLLEAGHSHKDIIKRSFTLIQKPESQNIFAIYYTFIFIFFIYIFFFISFCLKINKTKYFYFLTSIIFFLLSFFIIYVYCYKTELLFIFERYQRLQVISILIFSFFFICSINKFNPRQILQNVNLKLFFIFLLMPLIYAFGSNINYFKKSLDLGIFYFLASYLILLPSFLKKNNFNSIFSILFISLLIVILHINLIIEKPYRQIRPLKSNNFTFVFKEKNNTIKLTQETGAYLNNVLKITKDAGLVSGSYVLDLTGMSPGLIFLLGYKSLGDPWIIGGYPGSFNFAKSKIKSERCLKISNSWILHDQYSRSISLEIAKSFGASIDSDYYLAGSWLTKGFEESWEQKIFKPKNTKEIYQKCLNKFNIH